MSADNSGKIFLSKEEQIFLMAMLEVDTPIEAVEVFAKMMAKEGADPTEIQLYIKHIMKAAAKLK